LEEHILFLITCPTLTRNSSSKSKCYDCDFGYV
jgi:hypothetical protein